MVAARVLKSGKSEEIKPGVSVNISTEKIIGEDVKVSVWDSIFGCISIKN